VTAVKALETMARGQYNLNIAAAAQQSDEGEMRKRNLSMVDDNNTSKVEQIAEILTEKKWSGVFSGAALETFFEWYGRLVAKYPLTFIVITLLIPALSTIGLLKFKTENNPYKLWIPQNSDYLRNHEWLWEHFPDDIRFNSVIITAENVLTPETMKKLMQIHKEVSNTTDVHGRKWPQYCYTIPFIDLEPIADILNDDYDYDYDDYDEETDDKVEETNGTSINVETSSTTEAITTVSSSTSPNVEVKKLNRRKRAIQRYKRQIDLGFDPSIDLYPGDYCNIINDMTEYKCMENSLLEIWSEDNYGDDTDELLENLTQEDIIKAVNEISYSKVLGIQQDFTKYLGSIERNSSGHIVGAKATYMRFFGKVNISAITQDEIENTSKGSPVDQETLDWEQALIETLTQKLGNSSSFEYYINVAKSFADLSAEAITGDAFVFGCGTAIVFVYVQMMLGRFNFVEQRPGLSSVGICCCFLGLLTCYGVCSGLDLVFSPMHAIIPFLMLGIGIDDMFVIVQCYNNVVKEGLHEGLEHHEVIGLTMKHAGVAITVTSVTNILVFAIGASTVLPALQSFCLYCAVGILAVYIYQGTIFTAAFSLDQRRIESRRNGCLPFIKHKNWEPNELSKRDIAQDCFEKFGKLIMHPAAKVCVLLFTIGWLSVGGWGLSMLRQEFNPIWFIPQDSYLAGWFAANTEHFPKAGETVKINIAQIDYSSELPKIDHLVARLEQETAILSSVDSWYTKFKTYTEENDLVDGKHWFDVFQEDKMKFYRILTQFLFSPSGAKYRVHFNFVGDLVCGEAASEVLLSSIELTHKLFSGPSEWIPAMNKIKQIVAEANFSNRAFPVGTEYASWETDEIIGWETWRNMGISLLCVFITTVVLIQNIPACLLVLGCVFLTLVNVGGFIHFWGLTIDVISCVNLVIAVGLCVDYSAHMAHCFMSQTGTSDERAIKTLRDIGPAVLNGGFSTFLAFVLTAGSTSHVFATFFKVFFLVAVFGLYHALVLLPVMLSIAGPFMKNHSSEAPEKTALDTQNKIEQIQLDNYMHGGGGVVNKSFADEQNASNISSLSHGVNSSILGHEGGEEGTNDTDVRNGSILPNSVDN